MNETIERIVNVELASLKFELVELRYGGSKGRPVLDVRIDRLDGEMVQVGDCEMASRAIEARLDAEPTVISSRYVLEVSSPGMERPLKKWSDWKRFVGRRVAVNSLALHGRKELELVAAEGDAGDERIRLRDAKGTEYVIALGDVTDARLAFHWKP